MTDIDHAIQAHGHLYDPPPRVGCCRWVWRSDGTTLTCAHPALPSTGRCLLHTAILTDEQIAELIAQHTAGGA